MKRSQSSRGIPSGERKEMILIFMKSGREQAEESLISLLERKNHLRLDRVILAIPSATKRRCREITDLLKRAQIQFENVPSFDQLATGKVRATPLRAVRVEELFGNNRLQIEPDKIRGWLADRVVMESQLGRLNI